MEKSFFKKNGIYGFQDAQENCRIFKVQVVGILKFDNISCLIMFTLVESNICSVIMVSVCMSIFQAVVENHEVDSNIGNVLKCFLE